MRKKSHTPTESERRNFFRLSNNVLVEYRRATKSELEGFLHNEENIKADDIDITYLLDQISRQLTPLLINVRQESSAVAQYLELLNQKVDLLASMLTFEQIQTDLNYGILEAAETEDISEGGFSLTSSNEYKIDDILYCKLAIVGYRLGMETFGKVIRCEKLKDGKFKTGVELPYLKELDKKNLTRYIFDKQREQIRKRESKE